MSKKQFIYLSFVLVLTSCIDPITLNQEVEVSVLVVEGGITTEFGPHNIKLTKSAQYGDVFVGVIKNELGAKLFVRDDLGNTVSLLENGNGQYSTPNNFKGEIGREYTLIIITKNGIEYQSYPELLSKVPEIENVLVEYVEIPIKDEETEDDFISGVDLYVDFKDPSEFINYYKWKTRGTYSFKTHPELYKPLLSQVPVPKECCEFCYATEENIAISISSDRYYNGNTFKNKVLFIEDDGVRFYEKYIIEIEQLSISKEAYEFFELLNNQLSIKGNIFDPPPATIRGNIIGITNPDEAVVGYFTASDVTQTEYHIYGDELPRVVPLPIIPDDCREVRNGVVTLPENW